MDTEQKLAYLATLVHLIQSLYVDQTTDQPLRQRAKEQCDVIIDSLSKEFVNLRVE